MDKETVDDLIAQAADAVKKAKVPEAAQAAAFERALDLLLGTKKAPKGDGSSGSNDNGDDGGGDKQLSPEADSKIAKILGLSDEQAADIASVDDDGRAALDIPPSKLDDETKTRAQDLAVLTAAVQEAVDGKGVDWKHARGIADDHGAVDSNYSKNVKAASDYLKFSADNTITLRSGGRARAKDIAAGIVNGDD